MVAPGTRIWARRVWSRCCLLALAAAVATPAAHGQQLLRYSEAAGGSPVSAQSTALGDGPGRSAVEVDFELLRGAPETLVLETPDGHVFQAGLRAFEDRGAGDFLWSGHVVGAEWAPVLFTMVDGGLSGIFAEPGKPQLELHAIEGGEAFVLGAGWLAQAAGIGDPGLDPDRGWCGVVANAPPELAALEAGAPEAAETAAAPATAEGVSGAATAVPTITLSVSPEEVPEDAPAPVQVTVTATIDGGHRFGVARTIRVSVGGGVAVAGTDYAAVADFDLTIAAGDGSGSQSFQLDPEDDDVAEPHETVRVAGFLPGVNVAPAELELVSDDRHRIDVLVLYHPEAARLLRAINLSEARDARLQFDYANRVLEDAGVAATYHIVHTAAAPSDVVTAINRGTRAANALRFNSRETLRMRDAHDADIVFMMGGGTASRWHCGQAFGRYSTQPTISDYAYAGQGTTNFYCENSSRRRWMITAHELGHIMGGFHERGRNPVLLAPGLAPLFPYAYGYFNRLSPPTADNPNLTTIMAYGSGSHLRRLDRYSTARATWRGRDIGRVDGEEMDRLLRRTGPETAAMSEYIVPGPPSGLAGAATLSGTSVDVALTWTDESSREVVQVVEYRAADESDWTVGATLQPNVAQTTLAGLAPATRYAFRVRARNRENKSFSSEEWSVTTPGEGPPTRPTGLTASTPSRAAARLTWTDNSANETGFAVEYRISGGGGGVATGARGPPSTRT